MSVMSQMGSDPQWIASGFQTEDLNLEFSYIDANFTNTTGGTVFVGVWDRFSAGIFGGLGLVKVH